LRSEPRTLWVRGSTLARLRGGLLPYLAGEGHLDGHRDHLGQETPVEGHHEGYRVVVGEHQRHLVEWRNTGI
jgi:hypothetical protein